MAKPYDTRLIAVVAQEKFEVEFSQFCKLVPVMYVDGTRPSPEDFRNDGEVWWMLTAQTSQYAQPGCLVSCQIEDAREFDEHDSHKSRFQAQRESVRALNPKEDGLEVLDIAADAMDNIQDLVSGGYRMKLGHRPTPAVLLRWRSELYGPFTASVGGSGTVEAVWVSFSPENPDMTVYQIGGDEFGEATQGTRYALSTDVSPSHYRRSECLDLVRVEHDLLLASGFEQVLTRGPKKLILEPIDRKLVRFAKQCLTRKKRQDLRHLLDELEVTGRETEEAEELAEAIQRIKHVNDRQDAALDAVSKSLLDSGILGEGRLKQAEQEYAQKYVEERTAELQAKIEEAIKARREEARLIEVGLKDLQSRLQEEEAVRRARLDEELKAEREEAHRKIETEQSKLKKDKAELQRQEELLKENLQKVTEELRDAGDGVVNRFLAIAPLLGSVSLMGRQPAGQDEASQAKGGESREPATFELPSFVTATPSTRGDGLTEESFFNRFHDVVERSGFTYRLFDLQRFHVSVKCGELTVLGGPSGTGKSSLPSLYAQALLGEEADTERTGCLMVSINPSWMDIRDLLGHMNTLERRFYPAESGLFRHLVCAQEEYSAREASTGMYLACLDEMNLSQVEHYFSDFMMVLERRGRDRAIQCFSPEAGAEHCPFRKWARVNLPPSIRFVGTVNFDETTRLLSDRLLDRVNLIRLSSAPLPSAAAADDGAFAAAPGCMVSLADFQTWENDAALPSDLGSLLDSIRPDLTAMGCPLSPRVYRAMCKFVSSAPCVMPSASAFDAQLAQRIVPKIRNLVTRSQLDALDRVIHSLEESSVSTFDETMVLLGEVRNSASTRGWELGE